jgi:mRNA interferase YafQ
MKLEVRFSSRFKKDLKLAQKQNKNLNLLFSVIEKLANLEKLDEKYKDHSLLVLSRIGSHSDLFN